MKSTIKQCNCHYNHHQHHHHHHHFYDDHHHRRFHHYYHHHRHKVRNPSHHPSSSSKPSSSPFPSSSFTSSSPVPSISFTSASPSFASSYSSFSSHHPSPSPSPSKPSSSPFPSTSKPCSSPFLSSSKSCSSPFLSSSKPSSSPFPSSSFTSSSPYFTSSSSSFSSHNPSPSPSPSPALPLPPSSVLLFSLLLVLFLPVPAWTLSAGYYPVYDPLCISGATAIPAPWDCGGYIRCELGSGDNPSRAVWEVCPPGTLYDPGQENCVVGYSGCLSSKDAAAQFCPDFPQLVFVHADSCSLSYSCAYPTPRGPLLPYEAECRSPQLFDARSHSCVDRPATDSELATVCGGREIPLTSCDYRVGCSQSASRCEGLADGNYADLKRPFSQHYVTCQNGGLLLGDKTCQQKGQIFDPVLRQCNFGIRDDSVATFCSNNPSVAFADPYHCARHFECSQVTWYEGLRAKQSECRYPLLYDVNTTSCINFDLVDCGSRGEPIQPCDYIVGRCLDRPECIPCEASCLGLPNGYSAYPGHVLTPYHILCHSERTVDILNCSTGLVFDPQMRSCGPEISLKTLDLYCGENPAGRLAHPSECSLLYDCQQLTVKPNFPKYVSECKYPYLVDSDTVECKPHDQVSCGDRREPISPCDYLGYKCTSSNCQKCELVMPSCYGKLNGYYPVINQEMTSAYMECRDQRVVALSSCPGGLIFDMHDRKCVDTISTESMLQFCTSYLTGKVQNPTNCAQYYDCTKNLTALQECRYPRLYHVASQECRDYPLVECNGRHVFLEPCDSFTFCPVTPCPYCPSAFPTCAGRNGDFGGFQFDRQLFYHCIDDRMILGRCATRFDPRSKQCVGQQVTASVTPFPETTTTAVTTTTTAITTTTTTPITTNSTTTPNTTTTTTPTTTTTKTTTTTLSTTTPKLDVTAICHKDPGFVSAKEDNCAQFYNCSYPQSPLGPYVSECDVGLLFDTSLGRCVARHHVACRNRPVPLQVCHYQLMHCPYAKVDGSCVPCQQRFPSCWGMRDGPLALLSELSSSYVTCLSGRVSAIRQCPAGQFMDPSRLSCSNVLSVNATVHFCTRNPNGVTPHPLHCARFVLCRVFGGAGVVATPLGGECPYPQLFSPSGLCRPFRQVSCGTRYEPRAPCEYATLQQCRDSPPKPCPVCEERLPSCVGVPDGNRPYPARLFSPWFVRCDTGRTLAVMRCVNAFFDPLTNRCRRSLEEIMTGVVRNIVSFCQQYPKAVVADPVHCARFYNCSRSFPGMMNRAYLSECRFPSLFNRKTMVCDSFLHVVRNVGCGGSKEPLHQCEYASYCPETRYRTCLDCYRHLPTCRGLPNGLHTVPPGQTSSSSFLYCLDQRALVLSTCPQGLLFVAASRRCLQSPPPTTPPPPPPRRFLDPFMLAAAGVEPPEIW